jgi:hypothetical protein
MGSGGGACCGAASTPLQQQQQQQRSLFTSGLPVPISNTTDAEKAVYVPPPSQDDEYDRRRTTITQTNSGLLHQDELGVVPPPSNPHYDVRDVRV